MAESTRTSKKHTGILVFIIIILILAIAAVFTFYINRWSITITPEDGQTVTVEYGDKFNNNGATSFFHGSIIFKEGWEIPNTVTGRINNDKLGSYNLTYHSKLWIWENTYTQTIVIQDTKAPEITLVSDPDHYTLPGDPYEEEGFTATDNYDGDITAQVTSKEKKGYVIYAVKDSSGNKTKVKRKIKYDDPIPPEITLLGDSEITIKAGTDYEEPGFEAFDNLDGDITAKVEVSGTVNKYSAKTYTLTYTVTDEHGNTATAERLVTVKPLRQPDQVTPKGKIVYLTFDDGPGPYTEQLLDILDNYNVKVTFFTVNTGYSSLMKREAESGHTVAIHSSTHDYEKIYSSEDAFFSDLKKQQSLIEDITGIKTTLMRFPGGSSNMVSAKYSEGIMTKLTKDVTDMGFQYFDWNVLSGDAGDTTDTDVVYENVINGIQKHNVSVVLQHDIKGFSVDAVERIIIWGLENGYTFLPLLDTSPTTHQTVNN